MHSLSCLAEVNRLEHLGSVYVCMYVLLCVCGAGDLYLADRQHLAMSLRMYVCMYVSVPDERALCDDAADAHELVYERRVQVAGCNMIGAKISSEAHSELSLVLAAVLGVDVVYCVAESLVEGRQVVGRRIHDLRW
jgi:hypothetical protein